MPLGRGSKDWKQQNKGNASFRHDRMVPSPYFGILKTVTGQEGVDKMKPKDPQ